MERKIRKRRPEKQQLTASQPDYQNALSQQFSFFNFNSLIGLLSLFFLCAFAVFCLTSFLPDNAFLPFEKSFPMDSLLGKHYWSSLLSGHYFGLRSSSPNSPIVSMMWFRNHFDPQHGFQIRHWCNQDDRLEKFFWNYNDLSFGHQTIQDKNLQINTTFIKFSPGTIKARFNISDSSNLTSLAKFKLNSLILYSAIDNSEDSIEMINSTEHSENEAFTLRVGSKTAGNFFFHVRVIDGHLFTSSHLTTNSTLDQLKETVTKNMYIHPKSKPNERIFVIANEVASGYKYNFAACQLIFRKQLEVEIELVFDDADENPPKNSTYKEKLAQHISKFDLAFEEKFPLRLKNFSDDMILFARAVLSNTIGGVSYFNGNSLVKSKRSPDAKPYGPLQLLTAVPSRAFFPRGFLWDEGFHQLLLSAWDSELSKTIIKSWLGLMNRDGWIPREVVLGKEAMARVPAEFLVQDSTFANPPALFLAIENLIDQNKADKEWLGKMFPRLESWFNWFNSTQNGKFPLSFRWRGRNETTDRELNPKTLTSGLDDFPRASHPNEDEIHLDLRCWMALAARVMTKICQALSINGDLYSSFYDLLRDNTLLDHLHWSQRDNMYCDKGLHTDDLKMTSIMRNGEEQLVRKVYGNPQYQCIAHFGYVNLFPLIMVLLEPSNPKLEIILKRMEDPAELWTPYGLRSLSKNSFYYDKYNTRWDGPYWRGPVWIPINFLVLKGLNHYRTVDGPYQAKAESIYGRLRENLIRNVFTEYKRTNYVWEHYNDKTGHGQGTFPMTGWTALIVRIMGENY